MTENKSSYITGCGAKPEYSLVIDIIPDESLELVFTYKEDYFEKSKIEQISSYFYNALINLINIENKVLFDVDLYVNQKDVIKLKIKSSAVR
jgi:hypothetical protein